MQKKLYELTVVVDEAVKEKDLKAMVDTLLGKVSGKTVRFDFWGKKELAYPIQKRARAVYGYFEVEVGSDKVIDLQKRIKLEEKIFRNLLVVKNKRIKEEKPKRSKKS